ncbi:MAG: serine/threonine-protein phosphatase [Chloroflexia bacterium]|nr:serine/threonine-protein phosphatase [Chloroflexia bacterium]
MKHLQAAGRTDPGRRREHNEDFVDYFVAQTAQGMGGLFVVADGMGGRMAGELASRYAVETIMEILRPLLVPRQPYATVRLSEAELGAAGATTRLSETKDEQNLREAVAQANQVVYDFSQNRPEQARSTGTTVTMALVRGTVAVVANVGDSRTYLIRDRQVVEHTRDHSLVQSLVDAGHLEPQQVFSHPQRNVILRCLGDEPTVQVDTYVWPLLPDDMLLLCSDGLWEMIQDEGELIDLALGTPDLQEACDHLVQRANHYGGADNIGVVLVRVQ